MGVIRTVALADGTAVSVIVNDRRVWALRRLPNGKEEGWLNLDANRRFTEMPTVTVVGNDVIIDIIGPPDTGAKSKPEWWTTWRNIYRHLPGEKFSFSQWTGFRPLGPAGSTAWPTVPPIS